jgi:hypothetical protein
MKKLALLFLIACGPKQPTTPVTNDTGPVKDTRTELERRRDAACETLGPRITSCAIEDAKADLAAGKTTKEQFDKDTASGVVKKNTDEFIDQCRGHAYSSRQVRVLEVCQKEESECDPLLACLDNLNKQ